MSLHHDLLEQARQFATRERTRPKQSSLRRSVSASYYALFHLLLDTAARRLVSGNDRQALRHVLRRAFSHASMKKTAAGYTSGAGGGAEALRPGLNNLQLQPELMRVAAMFRYLQETPPRGRLRPLAPLHPPRSPRPLPWRQARVRRLAYRRRYASGRHLRCRPPHHRPAALLTFARPPKPRPIDTHEGPGFPQTAYIAEHHPRGATEWNCGTGR